MNGLQISQEGQDEAVDFANTAEDDGMATTSTAPTNGNPIHPAQRQRLEHEDYKKKRDSDPAFIPNRGNFFMHDTRGQPNGQVPPPRCVGCARPR